ncbi:uncharacterized protein PGTG_08171 [Puccinia graminis f. sp. tritici CRL 75-36-700-3]|uniref:Calcium-channel protein CCH1 n=1 Tax=Puccinia graminis f. sp. tritici (strain CRL 75-36-700-3 / race SCCL) TaxID=418459 RepID=E3KCH4_PUCGT|nr:uncharacterized protein PGTG_08171 [Puccinia graminis f. sp. tritici CRL 75-36-700-3]EFP81922.2 hypothetical protein PGTG_08171 [Puccinia graminis f. sp. tritici CRL 75-36-700-3]
MSHPSGHRANLLNLRFANNTNRATSNDNDHHRSNNPSSQPLSPSRVSSPSSSASSSSPNYTDFIQDHYGYQHQQLSPPPPPQQSTSTQPHSTLNKRPAQLDIATYVSSIRPPLSPVDQGNSACSPSSDRFRSSSTGSIHQHPPSPVGLHKRHSKSIHSKPQISPSSHPPPPIIFDPSIPTSSNSNLLSLSSNNISEEFINLDHHSQAMSASPPPQDSSSKTHTPHHPSNLASNHHQPASNSLSLTVNPENHLARNQKAQSYQPNDDLAFSSSPTLAQALASSLTPASVIAPAASSQSRQTHDRSSNHSSSDSPFSRISNSNEHSVSPKARPKASLVKRSTLRTATNLLRNASRRVVNLSGTEQIEDLPRPPQPQHQRRRPRSNTDQSNVSIELDYTGLSRPTNTRPAQPRFSDSEEDEGSPSNTNRNSLKRLSLSSTIPLQLKGKTLGLFGPRHPIRLGLFRLFHSGHIDPLIFLLIILDAVVLTIQSSKSVWDFPRPTKGYFHTWEDWALFILFCIFTVESVARIIVSGLAFNSISWLDTSSGAIKARGKGLLNRKDRSVNHLPIRTSDQMDTGWPGSQYLQGSSIPIDESSKEVLSFSPQTPFTTLDGGYPSPYGSASAKLPLTHPSPSFSCGSAGIPPSAKRLEPTRKDSFPISILHSKPLFSQQAAPFHSGIQRQQRQLIKQTAYLRQSWNRMDFIAVVCFWISFFLATSGIEAAKQIYLFRALSVLRLMRLLTVTSGTTRILNSLKRASPLLVNVVFFIFFAAALFSIVGVQSFKGSFDRHCVWIDPAGQNNYTFQSQSCGGQYNPITGIEEGFVHNATGKLFGSSKGYICPQGQLCMETGNPNNGTQSFDNVAGAAMQVVIIASANTWSNMMYSLMDAEYYASCAFFIVCLLVLNFWLLNILVAVITNTFAEIMDETKHSAFAVSSAPLITGPTTADSAPDTPKLSRTQKMKLKPGWLRRLNDKLYYPWVLVVLVQFSFQASRSSFDSAWATRLDQIESYFTIVFLAEILLRFAGYLPSSTRLFLESGTNLADVGLAIVTSIIQIPFIKRSVVYPWLTVFQIARFYRVIVAFPRTGNLLVSLRGSLNGLVNMILFLLAINFFSALFAAQYLRGLIPKSDQTEMTFYSMWNSFLAMYQIFSSENWTTVLYSGMAAQAPYKQAFISGIFLSLWFLFSNFVLLQMFIAVISEGFAVAEEQKKKEQIRALINRSNPKSELPPWFKRLNPYFRSSSNKSQFGHKGTVTLDADDLPPESVLPGRKSVMRNFLHPNDNPSGNKGDRNLDLHKSNSDHRSFVERARKAFLLDPTDGLFSDPHLLKLNITTEERAKAEAARQMEFLSMNPSQRQQYYITSNNEKMEREAQFIKDHPTYDKVFWFISQRNPIRKVCQYLVEPSYGERTFGRPANKIGVLVFKLIVFSTILGSVVVAAIATPVYKQHYYLLNGESIYTWFNLSEVILGLFFVVEFFIKVLADGFIFTPNAYLLNTWNRIDFLVLGTLVSDITASLVYGGLTSRFTRSLKAFRALRMINLTMSMRETFYNVLILGFGNLMDASVLTVMYIVPFAVWGQNLFAGLLYGCNDSSSSISEKMQCIGEYVSAPSSLEGAPSNFNFLMPRAWQNPYVYSFDSFRTAVSILFEIISQEGWISVMTSLMSITGKDKQPQQDASQWNAIYSLIYNLFGATIVLTLFLAVIINSFLKRSGSAFLTTEQQQWINLKKLIYLQQPSKRPKARPQNSIRDWCYKKATLKHGWWSNMMTTLYVIHVGLLMTLARSNSNTMVDVYRDGGFLVLATFYLADVLVALLGLGWISFQQNGWRIYDVIVIAGTFGTTIPTMILPGQVTNVTIQFQKFFLVAIAFKLVMKNNELNQLFQTALSSLPSIANLMGLWIVFFLVWAILFVENFSLTRAGPTSLTRYSNYQSLANALVMLAIQSTGEGWNAFMHDYTIEAPYCVSSPNFLFNDCGSPAAAYILFISWNVISMYIVLNMFTGLVVDNFAYVFQLFGKVKAIDREEVRRFKEAWAEVDRDRTGHLTRHQFIPFFSRLTGAFDVSIYPEELKMRNVVDRSTTVGGEDETKKGAWSVSSEVNPASVLNVDELNSRLATVDWKKIARRKEMFNYLYQEALLTEKPGRGISFNRMMLLVAHYTLIEDEQAMQLHELLDRKAKKQKIEEMVKFEKIQGILKMVVERRKFRKTLRMFSASSNPKPTTTISPTRSSSISKHKLGYY